MTWREPDSKPMVVDLDQDLTKLSPDYDVEGEPSTVEDEFAKPDAPEQPYEDDDASDTR